MLNTRIRYGLSLNKNQQIRVLFGVYLITYHKDKSGNLIKYITFNEKNKSKKRIPYFGMYLLYRT